MHTNDPRPPGQSNDEALIALVRRGDQGAFETLYDRHSGTVFGIALRITGERSAAEDVLQETFWRVWSSAVTFQSQRGAFTSWLFRIARNLAIDRLRRQRVRPQELIGTAGENTLLEKIPDPQDDVPTQAQSSLKAQEVHFALRTLPSHQRQVIDLAYFHGMTRREISEATGEALGTIHTRARLGLQKLRDELKKSSEFKEEDNSFHS